MFSFHDITDMINKARTCTDCGKHLNTVKEIRRCGKCKEKYNAEKKLKKKKSKS